MAFPCAFPGSEKGPLPTFRDAFPPLPFDNLMLTLDEFFAANPRLAIAFSGGLDSRFLCASALKAGCDVLAVHVNGPHVPANETRGAREFAKTIGLRVEEMTLDPLTVPQIANTDPLRCYYCKKYMLGRMATLVRDLGETDRVLCDGSNFDDLSKYRPGLRALEEEKVASPLAICGLSKKDIRERAMAMGIPLPEEGARPCLLTRYDYHLAVRREDLVRLEGAEKALLAILREDETPLFEDLRIRLTPSPKLQVTAFDESRRADVDAVMARFGFTPYEVLVTPTISGYYDRKGKEKTPVPA